MTMKPTVIVSTLAVLLLLNLFFQDVPCEIVSVTIETTSESTNGTGAYGFFQNMTSYLLPSEEMQQEIFIWLYKVWDGITERYQKSINRFKIPG